MDHTQLLELSSTLLVISFFIYVLAGVIFIISIVGKKWSERESHVHQRRWAMIGFYITLLGFLFQLGYYICRWVATRHAPISNMFEFMSFLSMMVILGFIILFSIYKVGSLGAFVLPLAITLIGWASVFDQTPQPLAPSLQSFWLPLHVSTVALAEGLLAVGFAAGLMYIIRTVDQRVPSWKRRMLEIFLCIVLMLVGFIAATVLFNSLDYEVSFQYINEQEIEQLITYTLPAIAGPYQGEQLDQERMKSLIQAPSWMKGKDAPRKLNTMLWSILSGVLLYILLRLILRKRLGQLIQPWLADLKPSLLDEISYRAIAIGFPLFTLGALIFAMIWAEKAWGRFWGWDPKEVWALITWLFYAAYLHLRLRNGWHGDRSAWLAVVGFIIIMFNLVFVNLIIAGMHSYASGG